jgi:peptidoglycan hydrolase-like protein with peptidoglycan-binding domain
VAPVRGSIGRVVTLPGSVSWKRLDLVLPGLEGIVTSTEYTRPRILNSNDLLLTLDLRPVYVAKGAVPLVRALTPRMIGPDVQQLNDFLISLGLLGQEAAGDSFTSGTTRALRAWQRSVGLKQSDSIGPDVLAFIPELPAVVAVIPQVGASLGAGSVSVHRWDKTPSFSAIVGGSLVGLVQSGMEAIVRFGAHSYTGTLGELLANGSSEVQSLASTFTVAGRGGPGDSLCGQECPPPETDAERAATSVQVTVVPQMEGLLLPASAVIVDRGEASVVSATGERIRVTVRGQQDGQVLVDGIDETTRVQSIASSKAP